MSKSQEKSDKFKKNAHILLVHIHSLCQRKEKKCIATTKYLAKIIGKSERQTYYYLNYLKESKQIHVVTSEVKSQKFKTGYTKFYQNRTIQSYHEAPSQYNEINDAFFEKTKKNKDLDMKNIKANIQLDHKLRTILIDKEGKPLPPKLVGKATNEFIEYRIQEFNKTQTVNVPEIPEKPSTPLLEPEIADDYNKKQKEKPKDERPTISDSISNIVLSMPKIISSEPDEEPEEGKELEWLKNNKYKKMISEEPEEEEMIFQDKIDLQIKPWWIK